MLTATQSIKEALEAGRQRLAGCGIELPGMKCEWLLSHLLGCRRLELALHYREPLPGALVPPLGDGLDRLAKGEPVQYVVGETEFMGHTICVDPRVLIPRPETEQLVEYALKTAMTNGPDGLRVADVGTGSGCIAIAVARALPRAAVLACDVSAEALEVARDNARRLGCEHIHFAQDNLLEHREPLSLDLVIANLPYIVKDEIPELPGEVAAYEPGLALAGGPEGTELISRLIGQCARVLSPEGSLFLEIGETQGPVLMEDFSRLGYVETSLRRDLAGRARFLSGKRPW